MDTSSKPFELKRVLERAGLTWCDHPTLQRADGTSFHPRAAIARNSKPITIICTVSDHEIEAGLTRDFTQARKVLDATHIIHLMPQAGRALVGVRFQNAHRYRFTVQDIAIDGAVFPLKSICDAVPVPKEPGWTDLPLSGQNLPTFADMQSFLSWYDFYPGKQRFEIFEGQVALVKTTRTQKQAIADVSLAFKQILPDGMLAIRNQLVRLGEITPCKVPSQSVAKYPKKLRF